MKTFLWLTLLSVLPLVVRADFATPFVEIHNEVGQEAEAHGHICHLGPEPGKRYLVLLFTDTGARVVLHAEAEESFIPERMIGREVKFRALVAAKNRLGHPRLKLLEVASLDGKPGMQAVAIPWSRAVTLVKSGTVKTVFQGHDQTVLMGIQDGKEFAAKAPEIDDIIVLVKKFAPNAEEIKIFVE